MTRATPHRPTNPDGRARPDRAMGLLSTMMDTYFAAVTSLDYDGPAGALHPATDLHLVVAERETVSADGTVVRLTLRSPRGVPLPAWHPGAHLDIHLPSGRRRQYSLCGDHEDRTCYVIAVRRIPDGGGGSPEMHALAPGDTVLVRGPRNGFPFVRDGAALFVAGGIGITPILAMTRAAQRAGMDWRLLYTGRNRAAMPFLEEIATCWDPSRVFVRPDDEYGTPTSGDLLAAAPAGGAVYCCGPTPMLDAVRTGFEATAAVALHFERFAAPPVVDGRAFEIRLASTGETLTVPADESALEVIRRYRPDIAYSCRQGFCGTCRVRVVSGTPEHRENRLTDDERRNEMLICVSRAAGGRLVLDL